MRENLRQIKIGMLRGFGIFLCVGAMTALSALMADRFYSFSANQVVSAGSINANFEKMPPVGAVIAWHKNMIGLTATLPDGWVECNGQVISDSESALDGQIAPNLNGEPSGANSPGTSGKYAMFLRGGTASGGGQLDQFQGHFHRANYMGTTVFQGGVGSGAEIIWRDVSGFTSDISITSPVTDGVNGVPRTGSETRPVNMSVVWILRIK